MQRAAEADGPLSPQAWLPTSGRGGSGCPAVVTGLLPPERGPHVPADPCGIRGIEVDAQVVTPQHQGDVPPPGALDVQFERAVDLHVLFPSPLPALVSVDRARSG